MQPAPPPITIRNATADDADDVDAVFEAAFASLRLIYRPTEETADRQADRDIEGTRLVAEIEGQIVATVQFDRHKENVRMIGLAVHPEFQRIGIACRLIAWIVAHVLTLGYNRVVLDTIKETGNVRLFEKLGFRVFHEEVTTCFVSEVYSELHEVRMERSIA